MSRLNRWPLLGLGVAGAALALAGRRASRTVRLTRTLPAPPEDVAEIISRVEREPALIPGVMAVRVLKRTETEVRYRVSLTGGARVRYRKAWSQRRIAWRAEAGTLRIRQAGLIRLTPVADGTRAELAMRTRFDVPVLGRLAAMVSRPFAAYAMRAWFSGLCRILRRERAGAGVP